MARGQSRANSELSSRKASERPRDFMEKMEEAEKARRPDGSANDYVNNLLGVAANPASSLGSRAKRERAIAVANLAPRERTELVNELQGTVNRFFQRADEEGGFEPGKLNEELAIATDTYFGSMEKRYERIMDDLYMVEDSDKNPKDKEIMEVYNKAAGTPGFFLSQGLGNREYPGLMPSENDHTKGMRAVRKFLKEEA
jgi:type I restriction-modification system DNA methylase subunit